MISALRTVRPALIDFYGSLSDEQKARFNIMGQPDAGKQWPQWSASRRQLGYREALAGEIRAAGWSSVAPGQCRAASQPWGSDGRADASSQYLALCLMPSSSSDFSMIQPR